MRLAFMVLLTVTSACEYTTLNEPLGSADAGDEMKLLGEVGTSVDLTLAATPQRGTVVDATAPEPGVITIQLGLNGATDGTGAGWFDMYPLATRCELYAEVTWGIRGGRSKAEIDLLEGQTLAVVADYVHVEAVLKMIDGVAFPVGAVPTFKVSAFAAPGAVPHLPPQRTVQNALGIAIGGNMSISPPYAPFARAARVVVVPYNVPVHLEYRDGAGVVAARYDLAAYPSEPLPIPASAQLVVIYNDGVAAISSVALIHELEL